MAFKIFPFQIVPQLGDNHVAFKGNYYVFKDNQFVQYKPHSR